MFRFVICGNDSYTVQNIYRKIQTYCKKNEKIATVDCYMSSRILMQKTLQNIFYDLYILEIEMIGYTGFELAKAVKMNAADSEIVFVTETLETIWRAYRYHTLYCILKEYVRTGVKETLDIFFTWHDKECVQKEIYVISDKIHFHKIKIHEIIYLQKEKKYVVFHLTNGRTVRERIALKTLYEKLKDAAFLKILDRSCIVNMEYVQDVKGNCIHMDDGTILLTSLQHSIKLKKVLTAYQ